MVEPLLTGATARRPDAIPTGDLQYARDLGLVTRDGPVAIANPIYREAIPRDLTYTIQEMSIHHEPVWYVDDPGALLTGNLPRAHSRSSFGSTPSTGWSAAITGRPDRSCFCKRSSNAS